MNQIDICHADKDSRKIRWFVNFKSGIVKNALHQ